MNGRPTGFRYVWLFALILALILVSLAALSAHALVAFERGLIPQLDRKMVTVGASVDAKLERALRYGIPLERLPGVTDFFGAVLAADPDLAYLAVTRPDGALLYQRGPALPTAEMLAGATLAALAQSTDVRPEPVAERSGFGAAIPPLAANRLGPFYNLALPLDSGHAVAGILHVGAEARFVAWQLREILFDIAIVFVIAALIAFELLPLLVHQAVLDPLRQLETVLERMAHGDFSHTAAACRGPAGRLAGSLNRLAQHSNTAYQDILRRAATLQAAAPATASRLAASLAQLREGFTLAPDGRPTPFRSARLVGARMATFLFVFATELSQPFLPLYARGLATALQDPPSQFLVGLPLTLFTLIAALSMPLAGWRVARTDFRRTFVEGALLLIGGLLGAGFAEDYFALLGWRALTAVGYGFMYVACQGYVVAHSPAERPATGGALFVSGIMAASICGPAIGGILADRIGYTATFCCAAALGAGAALVAIRLLDAAPTPQPASRRPLRGTIRALATHPRFVLLMLGAAVPAKLLLNGFLFFLVPLTLSELGASRSEIGRVAMLYGLAALFLGPTCARLADRFSAHGPLVGTGGLLAGLGLIPVFFFPTTFGVLAGVLLLGIGQAMSISAQLALVTRICKPQIERFGRDPVLGFYRLVERLGGAAGPLVAAGLAGLFGYPGAVTATGILGVLCATLFSVGFLMLGIEPEPDSEPRSASP